MFDFLPPPPSCSCLESLLKAFYLYDSPITPIASITTRPALLWLYLRMPTNNDGLKTREFQAMQPFLEKNGRATNWKDTFMRIICHSWTFYSFTQRGHQKDWDLLNDIRANFVEKEATYLTKHFKKTHVCDSGIHAITFIIACPALLWVYAWRPIGYKLSFAYPWISTKGWATAPPKQKSWVFDKTI